MDAAENLPRLDDAFGAAIPHSEKLVPPRPINPGEAKQMHRQSKISVKPEPAPLRLQAPLAPRRSGFKRTFLINPLTTPVAVNPGG